MNILLVDDEKHALENLERAINEVVSDAVVQSCTRAAEALQFVQNQRVDVVFLDIEMPEISGLELAALLKKINTAINIIFVTSHSKYTVDAFSLHASGYVLKPINTQRVAIEIENLRYPIMDQDEGVRIRCFGSFEVFLDGVPAVFSRPKAKEMLAYLIDRRGASVSKRELAAILWEEKNYSRSIQSHLHVLYTDMMRTLRTIGAEKIMIHRRGQYAIDTRNLNCDYYRYLQGNITSINSYHGEYMSDYSWAEFTAGSLTFDKHL